MFELPDPIHVALLSVGFAVGAFVLTIAQRVGDWRSKAFGVILGVIGAFLLSCWVYLAALWVFKVDLHNLFARGSKTFWISTGAASASAVLVVIARNWARRRTNAKAKHKQSITNSSSVEPPAHPPAAKTFVNRTPEELLGYYKGVTGVQGDMLIAPYKNYWITVRGAVALLLPDNAGFVVVLKTSSGGMIECRFADRRWADAFGRTHNGDSITIQGAISEHQNGQQLYLGECELVLESQPSANSGVAIPKVMAVRYGRAPEGFREGLYLENDGEAAFEVQPEPIILPDNATVRFDKINTLKKSAFSMATIEMSPGNGSLSLDSVWRDAMYRHPGFGAEVPLRLVYRNYEGRWFRCVCKFESAT